MNYNYDELFQKEAFSSINKQTLNEFKSLSQNIKNLTKEEAIFQIMNFNKTISEDEPLSSKEQEALIQTILISLPKEERAKFLEALEVISKFI